MLELRPNCERCDCDLPADSKNAYICSYECTYCFDCAVNHLHNICPNCGGDLVVRPIRPPHRLNMHPASTLRVLAKKP